MSKSILTLNIGSSSIKFAVYDRELKLMEEGAFKKLPVDQLFEKLSHHTFSSCGHRIVHGGDHYTKPTLIDDQCIENLKKLIPFSPLHLPEEIEIIEQIHKNYPHLKQVACFDTSFHRSMPELHMRFPLPDSLWKGGIKRFGFHGLSYEYILHELGDSAKGKRLIIAHLGSGASMAAVFDGKPVDTTMGFTPTGGLMMATRSGDLDPGVITYLMREKKLTALEIDAMLNHSSGLKGVSDLSSDMKTLLEKRNNETAADAAISLFCYIAKKTIGSLAAALGGVDRLVFTGGIGEKSKEIREEILNGLDFLKISEVSVIKTDENLMIASHTKKVLE